MAAEITQFIWMYIHSAARGDELRYSMRSVCQHFQGTPQLILVGDKPDWYCGQHIDIPRIQSPTYAKFHAVLDSSYKLYKTILHPAAADSFVVMMDDHYFLRDFSLTDLQVPRYAPGWVPKNRFWWDNATTLTMQALERRGMSTHLYETHLMHFFEKDKLQQIFETFDLLTHPLLRNTLYGNTFRRSPKDCRNFIASPQTSQSKQQLDAIAKRCTVLNHACTAWDNNMRSWLQLRLPGPTADETSTTVIACSAITS